MPYKKKDIIDRIIRVDHAGEYGAKRIYEGNLAVIDDPLIREMKEQELEHLEYFTEQIKERQVRPTILMPVWHVGGFMLGAISAKLGRKATMACTVAVEDEIAEHYQKQLDELSDEDEDGEYADLKEKITKFRQDEIEHKHHGLENDAEDMKGYKVFYHLVRGITKTAIALSERV